MCVELLSRSKHTELPVFPFPSMSYHKHGPIWNTYITGFCISSLLSHKWNFCKDTAATFWTQNHAVSLKFKIRAENRIYQKMRALSWKVLQIFMFLLCSLSQRIFIYKKKKGRLKAFSLSQSHTRQSTYIFLILTLL